MNNDPISDFLTRIRNASRARKAECMAQHSGLKLGIAKILQEEGFIQGYEERQDERGHRQLVVRLKYVDGTAAITGIKSVSKPGCRLYYKSTEIPRVLGGLGVGILTTSKGVKNDRTARREKIGGELICTVW
jgi:small subunit ribosomal protein S8